jgi:cytochrome c-type protein NapC
MARKRHSKAMDEGKTCIDCHKGVAHEEPDDPSI